MEDNNLMSLLDEMYEGIVEDEAKSLGINVEAGQYAIIDDNQANFFLKRLEEATKEKNKINDMCDKEINDFSERVNSFRTKQTSSLDSAINFFTQILEKYAQNELDGSKKKSIKLPFGTLQFKKSVDKYEYEDDILIKYIKDNDLTGLTRTKVELNKADFKKAIKVVDNKVFLNDIEIEGVNVTPGEIKFSIKL